MQNMKNFLIYGSYGYTGQLIVELAVKEGMRPILAGRDETKLRAQAEKYNLPYHTFSLDETARAALDWFHTSVPERTLHNWQNAAAKLIAEDLRTISL